MDPVVKRYFQKILNSFGMGLLWMFTMVTAGFYFKLALVGKNWYWYNGLFYALLVITFVLLIRYLYLTWRERDFVDTNETM